MKIVISILQNILRLRKVIEENRISNLDKKLPLAREVLSYPYKNPVIYSNYIINELNLSKPTTHAVIKDFVNLIEETDSLFLKNI